MMTDATIPDLTAREVEHRWPSPNTALYEGLRIGFRLGAEWASDPDAVHASLMRIQDGLQRPCFPLRSGNA